MAFSHATRTAYFWVVRCNTQFLKATSTDTHFLWTQDLGQAWLAAYEFWIEMGWPAEMLFYVEQTTELKLLK